ncbi:hypothetical protein RFI_06712 [Reticulomyxa filosa]|uniref:Serine/threonine specific protein phosphatases domain-containing protein n=1 Tax=Reticulomyxa filosa TaxID=46433 RepID=X6NX20_RETFI|nr:hypothetical protein RFI_06712 [Reticulomyxa filosa]|eukprot:ETO30408.1 hypothetical protein RFI_06712 [Reticulomyxa filosa]
MAMSKYTIDMMNMNNSQSNTHNVSQDHHEALKEDSRLSDQTVLIDVLWSDPAETDNDLGFQQNSRGVSCVFGSDIARQFCIRNDIDLVIRAHQVVYDGFEYFAGGHLITVFSATNYCNCMNNAGAILCVDSNLRVTPKLVEPRKEDASEWIDCATPPSPMRGSTNNSGTSVVIQELDLEGPEQANKGNGSHKDISMNEKNKQDSNCANTLQYGHFLGNEEVVAHDPTIRHHLPILTSRYTPSTSINKNESHFDKSKNAKGGDNFIESETNEFGFIFISCFEFFCLLMFCLLVFIVHPEATGFVVEIFHFWVIFTFCLIYLI